MGYLKNSVINQSKMGSSLSGVSLLSPSGENSKKDLASGLMLTSLVDCFTILVVYLLVATTIGGKELDTPKNLELPKASHSAILEGEVVLTVNGDKLLLNKEVVSLDGLDEKLSALRQSQEGIIIQADRRTDFYKLNPLITMSLHAGFKKIKFAVLQEDAG